MSIAIIKSGSKQYKVQEGEEIKVELLDNKKGSKIEFDDLLSSKKVSAEVINTVKGPKVKTLKYKNKTRYQKRIGHRQKYTVLKIKNIK